MAAKRALRDIVLYQEDQENQENQEGQVGQGVPRNLPQNPDDLLSHGHQFRYQKIQQILELKKNLLIQYVP
jgi:hypothetical protein